MKIHGVRIYPQSVKVVQGKSAPIFIHGTVEKGCSNFFYIFRPLAPIWKGTVFANELTINHNDDGTVEDPMPWLREHFGADLISANARPGLVLLRGDGFLNWGPKLHFCEGALLPMFRKVPTFTFLNRLYWGKKSSLAPGRWSPSLRSVLHMWDDVYWQLFSTERSDINLLIAAHAGDSKLKIYFVEFDREFPDPSNQKLQPAIVPG